MLLENCLPSERDHKVADAAPCSPAIPHSRRGAVFEVQVLSLRLHIVLVGMKNLLSLAHIDLVSLGREQLLGVGLHG